MTPWCPQCPPSELGRDVAPHRTGAGPLAPPVPVGPTRPQRMVRMDQGSTKFPRAKWLHEPNVLPPSIHRAHQFEIWLRKLQYDFCVGLMSGSRRVPGLDLESGQPAASHQ